MKSFPHQFNDLAKLTAALQVFAALLAEGKNPGDDRVFGEALARNAIYGFRRKDLSIEDNLKRESQKPLGNQGFRTAARDTRRFFALADLISLSQGGYSITKRGQDLLAAAGQTHLRNALWREAMLQLRLPDELGRASRPYRIMLRLVADQPCIETSKLLLALEAADDTKAEYQRITALTAHDLDAIRLQLKISQASARDAVKILPAIARQVGDIKSVGKCSYPAVPQLITEDSFSLDPTVLEYALGGPTARLTTPDDISPLPDFSHPPETAAFDHSAAIAIRQMRTKEHHSAVQSLAKVMSHAGFLLYEHPFDCLAIKNPVGSILVEVKTLDGSPSDERKQAERAIGQICGYRFFNFPQELAHDNSLNAIAFTEPPQAHTLSFLLANGFAIIWRDDDHWFAARLSGEVANFSPDWILA